MLRRTQTTWVSNSYRRHETYIEKKHKRAVKGLELTKTTMWRRCGESERAAHGESEGHNPTISRVGRIIPHGPKTLNSNQGHAIDIKNEREELEIHAGDDHLRRSRAYDLGFDID